MFLKRINNVVGYKNLPDGFNAEFSEGITYIVGSNFKGKTTVGSLFNWALTGTSLYGNEKEQVSDDNRKIKNVIVDISFVDNYGIEHRLIRDKGRQMNITLDDKEVKQEMLAQFYKNKDIFLVSHNPYYFASLEPKEQKELVRQIIPTISSDDAFELLSKEEQDILGGPIKHIGSYSDKKNEAINELEKEYNENIGKLQAYQRIALEQVEDFISFEKEETLNDLQNKYEMLSMNLGSSNLEDLKRSIDRLDEIIKEIIDDKLSDIKKDYSREYEKMELLNKEKSICSTCRQEIKDDKIKEHLRTFYKKELDKFQERANKLKEDVQTFIKEKNEKIELMKKLSSSDTLMLQEEKKKLKEEIDKLLEGKNSILLHNKEVQIKQEQINKAKDNIRLCETVQNEISEELTKIKQQKNIANKLKRLTIEKQKQEINKYLNKVNLEFCRENITNDKITECCDVSYEGREYKKLSKSQQARAGLEISNLFNNLSGLKAPIFLDDAESITDIQEIRNTQIIVSLVIKYNPLEVLYDYSEVLDRKKASIERESKEKEEFIIEQAA